MNRTIKGQTKGEWRRRGFLAYCILPSLILYLTFMIYPTLNVFGNSLFHWSGLSPNKRFAGLENFANLMNDRVFWLAFRNTIFLMSVVTVITMALSLFLAFFLTKTRLKERNVYRTLFFFPNVLSFVVIGTLFKNIYAPSTGILNNLLKLFGLDSWCHAWLGESGTVLWAIAAAMIWQAFGYYMVMYIAGMDSIPRDVYEAADIAGASKFRQFFAITVPLTWEIIRVTLVFFIASTLSTSFLVVSVMTNTSQNYSSEVLLSYMYRQAFTNANFGYSMAVAVFIFLFSLFLAIVVNILTGKKEN
nr:MULTISPECIES: sugar ABC transporter permease [unclassified Oceanispirochaeta]